MQPTTYYNEFDPFAAQWLRNLIDAGHLPSGQVDERDIRDVRPGDAGVSGDSTCHWFSGIGGWPYALQLAGWPDDRPVWTASCPCQPYSSAGKGKGDSDDRNLWPVLFELIRECRPQCIIGEQVEAAIRHGWLDGISADLEGEGYSVGAVVLGAHSVGAPHIRQRLYWVAESKSQGRSGMVAECATGISERPRLGGNSSDVRLEYSPSNGRIEGRAESERGSIASGCGVSGLGDTSNAGLQERGSDGRIQRGAGQPQPGQAVELSGDIGGLGDAEGERWNASGNNNDASQRNAIEAGIGSTAGWLGNSNGIRESQVRGIPAGPGIECPRSPWSNFDLIPCRDGKTRRIESGSFPLATGLPNRVGLLRGYGNSIVPQVAAAFIQAYLETECAADALRAIATETEFNPMPSSQHTSKLTLDLSDLQCRGSAAEAEPSHLPQTVAVPARQLPSDYQHFLASKRVRVPDVGFDVPESDLNQKLFPWQRVIVRWGLRRGRAGIFPDTGLGKTAMQLVIAEQICLREGKNFLLLAPLAVGRQTMLEAKKFGIRVPAVVCGSQESVPDVVATGPHIVITNYEKLHKFDAAQFVGVGLDESSILKSVDGKTRDLLITTFSQTPYRFCYTATPSPNDIMEIGSYSEFLGIMSRSEMLAMYFTHDGGDTAKWRLRGHAESEFFKWMAGWAVMLRKPSDIGYDDAGYDLPPLTIHEHVVETRNTPSGYLFTLEAKTLADQRAARRETINERVELAASLANADPTEPWITWCGLNSESSAAAAAILNCIEVTGSQPDWQKEQGLIDFTDGIKRGIVTKGSIAGWGLNWQHCCKATLLGLGHSWEQLYQMIRRIYRFGQQRPCDVHLIISDRDGAILANIHRKQTEADRLMNGMIAAMSEFTKTEIGAASRQQTDYLPRRRMELPRWAQK